MERLGLVGLPNSGKSSLFNALTGGRALVANHPFSTTESSSGIAKVPDERLEALAAMSASRKVVHTGVEIVDVAGLAAGASGGEGLGNKFLGGLRETDALCMVLRGFDDDQVPGGSDPLEDLSTLDLELVMADMSSLEGQLDRRRKTSRSDPSQARELPYWEEALQHLQAGTPLHRAGLSPEAIEALKGAFLLTAKPVLLVANLGEERLGDAERVREQLVKAAGGSAEVVTLCVQLEAEAAQLPEEDRAELLSGLGLGEGALAVLARAAYHLLGRRTFFTTGDKESRAWTFRAGAKAPECAGVIHSDLQRGFIRAEVIDWKELLEIGSWSAARAAGRLRVEGKDYEVADGDVLEIRFNV